jgi:hypothetical protein
MTKPTQTYRGGAGRRRGFASAGTLVQPQIRKVGETRGFAVSRLMTHWADVVGSDLATLCRPVKVGYGRGGIGATLTVLARGAAGPMLQARLPELRDRVNACYGYNAVSQIRVTQTSAHGFAEPSAAYGAPPPVYAPTPEACRAAERSAEDISDPELRAALAALGSRVMSPKQR